jgi:hypothetical protein
MTDQKMTLKTPAPMTTQIQKMSMCRSYTDLLVAVTPGVMFNSSAAANPASNIAVAPASHARPTNDIFLTAAP